MEKSICICGRLSYNDGKNCVYCNAPSSFKKYTDKIIPKRKSDEEIIIYLTENFHNCNEVTLLKVENQNLAPWDINWSEVLYCVIFDRPNFSIKNLIINYSVSDLISLTHLTNFLRFLGKENEFQLFKIGGKPCIVQT